MWQTYFRVIKVLPGKIIMPGFGQVDLSDPNIPLKRIQDIFEADCPYLEPTPLALSELYGHKEAPNPKEQPVPEPIKYTVPEPVKGVVPEPVEGAVPEPVEGPNPKPQTPNFKRQTSNTKRKPRRKKP